MTVDALLAALTLEEKASLTVARDFYNTRDIPRLDIPAIWLADGPSGLRKVADPEPSFTSLPSTCFPTASALGASWDVALVREVAQAIGVTVTVRNTGARAGREVVQLYVHEHAPRLPRPLRELKAFAKVSLGPGEAATVPFQLEARDLAVFDARAGAWVAHPGDYDILAGSSSRDLRLSVRSPSRGPRERRASTASRPSRSGSSTPSDARSWTLSSIDPMSSPSATSPSSRC